MYRFFAHFSPLLPILDEILSPNIYYAQLPLLFWSIVAVGSRRYAKDPTLLHSLTRDVMDLAMQWRPIRPSLVYVIESLLLLAAWPPPATSSTGDITFTLSGMIMNLALQIGLHQNPSSCQDFARRRISLSDNEINRRSVLWAWCITHCQR